MVLKLADDIPIVWRSPTSLQLGIDAPRIVLDDVGAGEERLIAGGAASRRAGGACWPGTPD